MGQHLILQKDLPNCPKGRIFKEDVSGNFFHSMTDEEAIGGNLKSYTFTKEEVADNPEWFGTECKIIVEKIMNDLDN
jgi:hypothetical protein